MGFTLLEVVTAVFVIAILLAITTAVMGSMRQRAQRVQCAANLRNLHIGAELHVQQNGMWPQIAPMGETGSPEQYAKDWIAALEPFGIPRKTWICPTVQNILNNPDYTKPEHVRIDYVATTFDDKPTSPHEWPTQPWFAEIADAHGNGNLVIFTDGSVKDLSSLQQNLATPIK